MYFVILWKNRDISLKELQILNPTNIKFTENNVVLFDTQDYKSLYKLWWIIKWGRVDLLDNVFFEWINIVGTNHEFLWNHIKRNYWVRRFKFLELEKSDLEIKEKWMEIIYFWEKYFDEWVIWVVEGYQDIKLFEEVDFGKPVRGMEIGMMPAKLALIILNIWINKLQSAWELTVYDPFVGFGTTWFLANHFGYNFIWSDINITPLKENIKWWQKHDLTKSNLKFTIFKHDVLEPFDKPFLKNVDLIVTEWWLWPVIKQNVWDKEFNENMNKIYDIYKPFLVNINNFFDKITVIFTIPVYAWKENFIKDRLLQTLPKLWFEFEFIDEIYQRKNQKVGRQIVIIKK